MNTIDCIKTRRSIRKFTDKKITREVMDNIVAAAAYAPSWKNTQITRYIVINDSNEINKIAEQYTDAFNAKTLSTTTTLVAATVIKARSGFERDGSFSTDRGDGWQMFDCGIACQTLSLAAHEYGIGCVILGVFDRPALEKYLEIPEDRELVALVAMGYPDGEAIAPKRKSVEELVSYR